MKRLIVLLLVIISFKSYSSEELSAEQQQLVWNFIYENMLSKEYLPNIFKEDITINLKGEVTSEDSIIVKELIKSFQKVIPHHKIELLRIPGNYILGLNDEKNNRVTTNISSKQGTYTMEMYFPTHLTQKERKQFIYYHLFHGLVFYQFPNKDIPELKGCVYAEKNFQSVIYSPYDLFILEKLYAPDFSIQLSQNLPPSMQETAWNNIRLKFLAISKTPVIYRTDISINLIGNVSREDSSIMKELIDQVKLIIPNRKIYLASEKGNLEIDFLYPLSNETFGSSTQRSYTDITFKKIDLKFSPNTSKEVRKKTLYYHLIRSLADNFISTQGSMTIPGSVFDEKLPENSSYHPIDVFMVNKLYSDDFLDQFKNDWIKRWPERTYYTFMYYNQLRTGGNVAGILLAIILISILLRKGIFKFHEWKLNRFIVQVIWMLAVIDLYFVISLSVQNFTFLYFIYEPHLLLAFVLINLTILIVTLLFFLIERKLNRMNLTPKERLLYLITNSFIISFTLSMAYLIAFNGTDNSYKWTLLFGMAFTVASIVASIRFLLFTFSELKRNELKEKDLELTLLREKNKQAELQSLRAKINPHFLYNALNSIASLATTDGQRTEQMALSLSDFFKYAINREQKQLNSLSEELNAIRTYLEIEKVRFGDRLNFDIDCPAELVDVQIPQLIIQPLVENALKHGLSQITDKGLIKVVITQTGSQLKIRVYDNGPAFPEGPLTGFGIQNTQERISLIYGGKAGINWQNKPDKYIEISLPLNK